MMVREGCEQLQMHTSKCLLSYVNMVQTGPSGVKLAGDTWLSWMSHTA